MKTKNEPWVGLFILMFGILLLSIMILAKENPNPTIQKSKNKYIERYIENQIYTANYNNLLLFIMHSEGFSSKPYICPSGFKTIGFGHVIKPNEHYNSMNYREAFECMECDIAICLEQAKELGYDGNKRLAVAHMYYSCNHNTVPKILANINNIEKYSKYMTKNGYVHSDNILNSRLFEKELWYTDGIININKFIK